VGGLCARGNHQDCAARRSLFLGNSLGRGTRPAADHGSVTLPSKMGGASALAPATSAGVECKRMDAPKLTPSMRTAMQDLNLDVISRAAPLPAGRTDPRDAVG
jgi:hypothetical protein